MKSESIPKLELEIRLIINEQEARALSVLPSYGVDAFIKHFYSHLGKSYLEKHESGLRSFLTDIGPSLGRALNRMDAARAAFSDEQSN